MANIEKLLEHIDLIRLAEQAGSAITRNGRQHRGNCPLHKGHNRTAFAVWESKDGGGRQLWRCFGGCDAGGDAIEFYQRWRGVDFLTAVRDLAGQAHLSLEDLGFTREYLQQEQEQRRRTDVLDEAARYFHARLKTREGKHALGYLLRRGFTRRSIRQAGFGFSAGDNGLARRLTEAGCDLSLARELGLIRSDGADFTANGNGRAAAPHGWIVYAHRYGSRTCYLSARAVEIDGLPRPNPEDKSRNLPGGRQVYWAAVPGDESVVIVEGPADAESLRQVGQSAVALCGLGEMPADDLARLTKRDTVYLAIDNDSAAIKKINALDSSITRLLDTLGPLTRITSSDKHKDWNAWLQVGLQPDTLQSHLTGAAPWLDVRLKQLEITVNPSELDDRMTEIGRLLSRLPMAAQLKWAKVAARSMGVGLSDVKRLIAQATNNGGVNACLSEIRQGRITFLGETLANFAPRITHELILDDGENTPICHYTITGRLDSGEPLEPVEITAEEFPTLGWVARHWGARAIIHLPKGRYNIMARAIQEISLDDLQRERVYQYSGWASIDGKRVYLTTAGAMGVTGLDTSVRVDLGGNNLRHYALPAPASGNELAHAVSASVEFLDLADRKVTAPLWAAMYAAPLTSVRSLNAVLWVYGPTQSGKSTITHLALAHFGKGFISGREYHAPMDWTSTGTALEGALFRAKDCPLVIDDFAPQFTSRAEALSMHKKAHLLARSVGNRSSRGRARADLTEQVTRVPRGLAIATAENPLMGQSVVGRMIYVTVEHGQVMARGANARLDAAQQTAQSGLYASAMSAYIHWLVTNWERASETYIRLVEESVSSARCDTRLQNRLPDYFGILDAAQQLALTAFFELGLISAYDKEHHAIENSIALLNVIAGQAEKIALESPVRKFFEALSSLLSRRHVYLSPRVNRVEFSPPERAEQIGWFEPFDDSVVYLEADICLQLAKNYWRDLDENMDILPDALKRQIAQAGLLKERGKDTHIETSKWIAGKTRRVLAVDAARAADLYTVDLRNEDGRKAEDEIDLPA